MSYDERIFTDFIDDLFPSLKRTFIVPKCQLPSSISNLNTYLNDLNPLLLGIAIWLIHLIIYALLFKGPHGNKNIHPSVIAVNHEARLLAGPQIERKQVAARPRAKRILRTGLQEQLYRAAQKSTSGPQSGQKRKRSGDGEDGREKKARLSFILESLVV